MATMPKPRVVIVGGGFAGLNVGRGLKRAPVDVTLVDQTNHHVFQPLLYQVATAGLSAEEIAVPIRSVFRTQPNVKTLYGEVVSVDFDRRRVLLASGAEVPYEYLVLAAGTRTNYYGHDAWEKLSTGLKTIEDALTLRHRILRNFELAEATTDEVKRRTLLTSVVIGGGPTGVELAGALSELSRRVLLEDFRTLSPQMVRVVLVERADRVLTPFDARLSQAARKQLEQLGVELQLSSSVTDIDTVGAVINGKRLAAGLVAWTTGVRTVPLASRLSVQRDRSDRVVVDADCSVPGHPDVFVIGDMASYTPRGSSEALPGLAPVAIQQGRYVAKVIRGESRDLRDVDFDERGQARHMTATKRKPFKYLDKGIMATIGRSRAVLQFEGIRLSGFIAWVAWLVVHIYYLIGFRNRVLVLYEWALAYLQNRRGSRIIEAPWSELEDDTVVTPPQQTTAKVTEAPTGTSWSQKQNLGRGRPS